MTIYRPDTCDCVIEYSDSATDKDKDPEFKKVISACKEHASLTGQALYKAVLAHNRSFNLKYGRKPTEEQIEEITNDKKTEFLRIKNLQ